jgi:hypothetical protein
MYHEPQVGDDLLALCGEKGLITMRDSTDSDIER